jgi:TolA-binding protein
MSDTAPGRRRTLGLDMAILLTQCRLAFHLQVRMFMAGINKLSVEKALEKLRSSEAAQSKNAQSNDKIDALDEEIERMRAQRLRLERHQRRRDQDKR